MTLSTDVIYDTNAGNDSDLFCKHLTSISLHLYVKKQILNRNNHVRPSNTRTETYAGCVTCCSNWRVTLSMNHAHY